MTHTEAKGIAFTEVWHPDGWKMNITSREDSAEMAGEALVTAVKHLEKFAGFSPTKGTYTSPDLSHASAGQPTPEQAETPDRNGDLTIQVSNIKLASGGDHPRWVVQGGNFTKYGITCWPEVLEEAGLTDKLNALTDNLPEGQWLAYYVENAQGKPDKVTKLVRQ